MNNKKTNYFTELDRVDVTEHIQKKGRFNYLSWAYAVRELKKRHPGATWEIHEWEGVPFIKTECGFFVKVTVRVSDVDMTQVHPVLDHQNKPIQAPNSFQINTSIQRCLAKAIALHGLGIHIYAGEDLPEPDALTAKEEENLYDFAKPLGKELIKDLKSKVASMNINANNYEACMDKIRDMKESKKQGGK